MSSPWNSHSRVPVIPKNKKHVVDRMFRGVRKDFPMKKFKIKYHTERLLDELSSEAELRRLSDGGIYCEVTPVFLSDINDKHGKYIATIWDVHMPQWRWDNQSKTLRRIEDPQVSKTLKETAFPLIEN